MMTWLGEASTPVAYNLQDAAQGLGFEKPWILGLANGYTADFTTEEEYKQRVYDSCSSRFGWKGADRIQASYKEMLADDGLKATTAEHGD